MKMMIKKYIVSGADESSIDAGPAQVIPREVEREVPAGKEVEVEKRCVNVLFTGHAGAGKSRAIRKMLKLGGRCESTIQKLKETEDKSRENWSMADTMAANEDVKGKTIDFGEAEVETETTKYHILEAPSHYHYVYKLKSRALLADIALLVVSGSNDDLAANEKIRQTTNCIKLITTLNIPKILLVVSKMDDPFQTIKSFEDTKTRVTKLMPKPEKVVKSLSLSCEIDSDIQKLFDSLDTIEVPLQTSQRVPFRPAELKAETIECLVLMDLYLDDTPFNGINWYCRAKSLLALGYDSEAFEAANKAREFDFRNHSSYRQQEGPLKHKMEGDHFRAIKNYERAIKCYEAASDDFQINQRLNAVEIVNNIIKEMRREKICVGVLANLDSNLVKSPDDAVSWYRKATLLADLKMFEEAFDAAKKALEYNYLENPSYNKEEKQKHPLLYKMEGDYYREQKEFDSAVKKYISACDAFLNNCCEKAIEVVQKAINECLSEDENVKKQQMKIREEDLAKIDQALFEDPKNAASWYEKAKILADLQKFEGAFEAAQKASDYDYHSHPSYKKECHPLFFKMEGDHYYAKQEFDHAHEQYIKARKVFESDHHKEAVCLSQVLVGKALSALYDSDKVKIEEKKEQRKESSDASQNKEEEEEEKLEICQSIDPHQSSSKSSESKKIKVACSSEFLIAENTLDYVYSGFKIMNSGGKLPRSLIECSKFHKEKFEILVSLGLNSVHILSVDDMLVLSVGDEHSTFLSVESVRPVESYFTLLCQEWVGDHDYTSLEEDEQRREVVYEWWNYIKLDFKKIFRDVVDGLAYLYSRGFKCGNFLNAVFVSAEGHGRVLPSMDPKSTHGADIHDLVVLVKKILFSPFSGKKGEMSLVPDEVSGLVYFLLQSKGKLKFVPFIWLIDYPIFWTFRERAMFIMELKRVVQRFSLKDFNQYFDERLLQMPYYEWRYHIPDGVFKEIWRKGDPNMTESLAEDEIRQRIIQGWFKVKPYVLSSDILRFMNAVYTHHNDKEYRDFRSQELDLSETDEKLREIFPRIHEVSLNALFDCVREDSIYDSKNPSPKSQTLEALKEISRHSNLLGGKSDKILRAAVSRAGC